MPGTRLGNENPCGRSRVASHAVRCSEPCGRTGTAPLLLSNPSQRFAAQSRAGASPASISQSQVRKRRTSEKFHLSPQRITRLGTSLTRYDVASPTVSAQRGWWRRIPDGISSFRRPCQQKTCSAKANSHFWTLGSAWCLAVSIPCWQDWSAPPPLPWLTTCGAGAKHDGADHETTPVAILATHAGKVFRKSRLHGKAASRTLAHPPQIRNGKPCGSVTLERSGAVRLQFRESEVASRRTCRARCRSGIRLPVWTGR